LTPRVQVEEADVRPVETDRRSAIGGRRDYRRYPMTVRLKGRCERLGENDVVVADDQTHRSATGTAATEVTRKSSWSPHATALTLTRHPSWLLALNRAARPSAITSLAAPGADGRYCCCLHEKQKDDREDHRQQRIHPITVPYQPGHVLMHLNEYSDRQCGRRPGQSCGRVEAC
jgi:hypothetical protein